MFAYLEGYSADVKPSLLHIIAHGMLILRTVPTSRIRNYSLHSLALYGHVSFDLKQVSPSRGKKYPLYKEERQNCIPLQSLSRICSKHKNMESWLSFMNHLKPGIWYHASVLIPRDLDLRIKTAASITARFLGCSVV